MDNLNKDVLLHIGVFLEEYDLVSLALTNKYLYKHIYKSLWIIRSKCIRDLKDIFTSLACDAMYRAKLQLEEHKSTIHTRWEVSLSNDLRCYCFKNRLHKIRVTYIYCPYDLDILYWYEGNVKSGSMIL
jgi:hypothetical protein